MAERMPPEEIAAYLRYADASNDKVLAQMVRNLADEVEQRGTEQNRAAAMARHHQRATRAQARRTYRQRRRARAAEAEVDKLRDALDAAETEAQQLRERDHVAEPEPAAFPVTLDGDLVVALDLAERGVQVQGWSVVTVCTPVDCPDKHTVLRDQDGRHFAVLYTAWAEARLGRVTAWPVIVHRHVVDAVYELAESTTWEAD